MEVLSGQFLWSLKNYLLRLHHIFLLFDKSIPLIFQMCFKSSIIAYLCRNMIDFNVVGFSEHCSEEVISFFWHSYFLRWTSFQNVRHNAVCVCTEVDHVAITSTSQVSHTRFAIRKSLMTYLPKAASNHSQRKVSGPNCDAAFINDIVKTSLKYFLGANHSSLSWN